jgi:hypothetical protein
MENNRRFTSDTILYLPLLVKITCYSAKERERERDCVHIRSFRVVRDSEYISTSPPNCNIYFTFICSYTQHVSAIISHHHVYFLSLKLLPVLILLSSYICSFLPLTRKNFVYKFIV